MLPAAYWWQTGDINFVTVCKFVHFFLWKPWQKFKTASKDYMVTQNTYHPPDLLTKLGQSLILFWKLQHLLLHIPYGWEKYTIIVVLGLFSYTSTKIRDEITRSLLLLMYPIHCNIGRISIIYLKEWLFTMLQKVIFH